MLSEVIFYLKKKKKGFPLLSLTHKTRHYSFQNKTSSFRLLHLKTQLFLETLKAIGVIAVCFLNKRTK